MHDAAVIDVGVDRSSSIAVNNAETDRLLKYDEAMTLVIV